MRWKNGLVKKRVFDLPVADFTPIDWHGRLYLAEISQTHWDDGSDPPAGSLRLSVVYHAEGHSIVIGRSFEVTVLRRSVCAVPRAVRIEGLDEVSFIGHDQRETRVLAMGQLHTTLPRDSKGALSEE